VLAANIHLRVTWQTTHIGPKVLRDDARGHGHGRRALDEQAAASLMVETHKGE